LKHCSQQAAKPQPYTLPLCRLVAGLSREEVLAEVGSMRWGDFKPRLADALVAHLEPIQQRYHEVMRDEGALDAILAKVGYQLEQWGSPPPGLLA
jgi:tryptophanyl-tRNA synthetase